MRSKLKEPLVIRINPEFSDSQWLECGSCGEMNMKYASTFLATVTPTEDGDICELDLADELTGLVLKCDGCGYQVGITGVTLHLDSGEEIEY